MERIMSKVEFSNLDKILYPAISATKMQVIKYYAKVAPRMLPFLRDRPAVLTRFPEGVAGEGFYEKDAPMGTPKWVKTFRNYSEVAKRAISYIVCDDLDTLMWLANLAALEMHVTLARTNSFLKPDMVLFDLDPQPPAGTDEAIEVALLLRDKLDRLRLKSFVKTSGKRGLHVQVPIDNQYSYQDTRGLVHTIGKELSEASKLVASEHGRSRFPGKVLVDYAQNSHGKTMICPYSLRATPEASVSTPIAWKELEKGLKPEKFNIVSVAASKDEPWKGIFEHKQKLKVNNE